MVKNVNIVRLLILIAQKKPLDALNATQKTEDLCYVPFLKNLGITVKHFFKTLLGPFLRLFLIFPKTIHWKELCFFVLRSVSQGAFLSYQN